MTFVRSNGNGKGDGSGNGGVLGPFEDYAPIWPVVPGTRKLTVTINTLFPYTTLFRSRKSVV